MGTYLKKPVRPLVRFLSDNLTERDYLWWGNFAYALPLCVYVNYLPMYRMRPALAGSLCIPYPTFIGERKCPRKRFRQHAFFVFAPGAINTSFKRPYTDALFKDNAFFIPLKDALGRLEYRGERIFLLGYDWARSGGLDENSRRLKETLDRSFPCTGEHNFDGIHVYIYEVRAK